VGSEAFGVSRADALDGWKVHEGPGVVMGLMAERTLRCRLEDIAEWYPVLFLEPYVVACVAAMSRYSRSPAYFAVDTAMVRNASSR
jgi:hypothetical protein